MRQGTLLWLELSLLEPLPIWASLPSLLYFRKVPLRSWSFLCWPGGQGCWHLFWKACHPGIGEGVGEDTGYEGGRGQLA